MEADLRRSADRLDRRDRRRAVGSEHHLRRQRRRAAPSRPVDRRRHLQVHRRRQDVDAPRAARRAADPEHRRRSARSRTACSSRRSAIRTDRTRSAASIDRPTAADTFQKVLYKDENTGGNDVDIDPSNPNIVYATLWEERQGPWENAVWAGTSGGIFKSTDGGTTWKPVDQRTCRSVIQANLAIAPANPQRLYATVAGTAEPGMRRRIAASGGIYRATMPARRWTRITTDTRPAGRIGGGDLPMPLPASEEPRHRDHREHRVVEVDRRRQDVGAVQGRARRRGLSERLDQSRQSRHHPARRRSGRGRHAERRRDVELLVQPADRAAVSRHRRQRVSVSRVQRPAGERLGVRREPRQLRRDLDPRLAAGRRRRIRVRRARSAEPGHRLRRPQRHALRSPHRPGLERRARRRRAEARGAARKARSAQVRTMPVVFSEVDKRALFFANNHLWKTIDGGATGSRSAPISTRKTWEIAEERRQVLEPAGVAARRSAASSTRSRRRTRTSTASGSAPTTG